MGAVLGLTEPPEMIGREAYDIAWWAQYVRLGQRALPQLMALLGLNAAAISRNVSGSHPTIAAALAGGEYPFSITGMDNIGGASVPAFASWELTVAKALYWYIVPAIQFAVGIIVVDSWQYFLHRLMHVNKWMYSKF